MSKAGKRGATIATFLAVMGAAAIVATSARAASYRVIECTSNYSGVGAPDAQPFASGIGPALTDACTPTSSFGGLIARGQNAGAPHAHNASNGWRFNSPAATQFLNAFALAYGNGESGVFPEIVSVNAGSTFQWPGTGSAMDGTPDWVNWNGEGGTAQAIEFRVRCVVSGGCGSSGNAYITAQQLGFTLSDGVGPSIGPVGGPLLDTRRSERGAVGVEIGGSDAGSGVYMAYVEAAGSRVGDAVHACEVTSDGLGRRLVPCPGSATQAVSVNTADSAFHTGLNRLRLCVADFAGQTACQDAAARIDNACPDAGIAIAKLRRVRFRGGGTGRKATARTRFGRRVKLRGRAVDGAGNPVPRARICLAYRTVGHPYRAEEVIWTNTGRSGRFRFKLRRGPSRDFRIAAWQGGAPLEKFRTLLVKAKPTLKIKGAARPGDRIRLRVKLNRPRVAGKRVRIQAKSNAGWVGVPGCSGRTSRKGRFGCRERVPEGTAGGVLKFRAVVPREDGYPYLRGHSRVKSKRIRG